jgi:crotonobetainyl-CoA:carnitine CoA-transferase CaiB-like acyl-CoA transferase
VSLCESVFNMMESLVPEYDLFGFVRERSGGALPGICPSNTSPTHEGRFVVVAGNSDAIFRRLMIAIERPDLASDPALAHNEGRVLQAAMIDGAIGAWTGALPMKQILAQLEAAQVPCSPIYSVADLVEDEHFKAREMIVTETLPDGTPVKMPGIFPRLSQTPGERRWLGPELGAHTQEILGGMGYGAEAIDAMRASKAVG